MQATHIVPVGVRNPNISGLLPDDKSENRLLNYCHHHLDSMFLNSTVAEDIKAQYVRITRAFEMFDDDWEELHSSAVSCLKSCTTIETQARYETLVVIVGELFKLLEKVSPAGSNLVQYKNGLDACIAEERDDLKSKGRIANLLTAAFLAGGGAILLAGTAIFTTTTFGLALPAVVAAGLSAGSLGGGAGMILSAGVMSIHEFYNQVGSIDEVLKAKYPDVVVYLSNS